MNDVTTIKGMLSQAEAYEEAGDHNAAIEIYQQVISKHPKQEQAYERLMILYRKMKDYKKELAIIDKGIKAFEKLYAPKASSKMKKIAEISLKMAESVGLADKKGEATYDPEPIGKWKKRRLVVEKKIK